MIRTCIQTIDHTGNNVAYGCGLWEDVDYD